MSSLHEYKNGIRYHRTPLGLFPGVTSVLSETKDRFSQKAISNWKKNLGEDKAEAYIAKARERGTIVHGAIEKHLIKQDSLDNIAKSIEPEYSPLVNALEPVLAKISNTRYIEQSTYHPVGYGGSPDLIAEYEGKLTVIDWKTASKPKKRSYIKDYILQVCAYISSANYCFDLNIDRGLIVISVEGLSEPQLFEINPKQYKDGWEQFKERIEQFYRKHPQGEF